jgi:D-arabinose 1-dehydrogenase-like Zn-dependent alcohol dehydrogenase
MHSGTAGAIPSDLVAVQDIGGLGHLGIQFAAKFGYDVVAIGRDEDKQSLASTNCNPPMRTQLPVVSTN